MPGKATKQGFYLERMQTLGRIHKVLKFIYAVYAPSLVPGRISLKITLSTLAIVSLST